VLIALILVIGTFWTGQRARQDTEKAVNSVSLLYLDELAGRREQVVSSALQQNIDDLSTALELMTDEDFSDAEHMQAYQSKMKKLYTLEKFAFVDKDGLISTSTGTQNDIADYNIDYLHLTKPQITLKDPDGKSKKVIIAVPVSGVSMGAHEFTACFMEIDMKTMLKGVSLSSDHNDTTFCNIYTKDGVALTDMVLGGLASESNLLDALEHAEYEGDDSADKVRKDFEDGNSSYVTFTYNGITETLSYIRIDGTDWMLTYLIRESVISDKINSVSNGNIVRSLFQTFLTAFVLLMLFVILYRQEKRTAQLALESRQHKRKAVSSRRSLSIGSNCRISFWSRSGCEKNRIT
jgi:hypothetical protein